LSDELHFVDANVPMYAVGADHPLKLPCLAVLEEIARGERIAVTDVEVLQEILHRYTALGQRARAVEVAELFMRVVPAALPVTREDFVAALALHMRHVALEARDTLHLAVMERHGIRRIISADRHFDGIAEVVRLDPSEWSL
jgi:uncharacterized protein